MKTISTNSALNTAKKNTDLSLSSFSPDVIFACKRKSVKKNLAGKVYLEAVLVKGDVLLHPPGPHEVDLVLVEGQQEHDQHEDRVDHREVEDDPVT